MRMSYRDRTFCEGENVNLRRIQLKDAPLIRGWKLDPLVRRMALGPDARVSLASQRDDIERAVSSESELYLLIVLQKTHKPIGYVRINWLDECKRFAWLRFALGEERGKGYAKDATGVNSKKDSSRGRAGQGIRQGRLGRAHKASI